jgi:hypothetical protein
VAFAAKHLALVFGPRISSQARSPLGTAVMPLGVLVPDVAISKSRILRSN